MNDSAVNTGIKFCFRFIVSLIIFLSVWHVYKHGNSVPPAVQLFVVLLGLVFLVVFHSIWIIERRRAKRTGTGSPGQDELPADTSLGRGRTENWGIKR